MRLGFVWPSSMVLALGEGKEEVRIFGLFDFCLTVHHQLGKVIQMNQLDATMIY